MTLRLRDDQRGFVVSGIALLLVLPAMLLAASCLRIVETGGETTSLQTLSDKVSSAGRDIERMINDIQSKKLPIENATLNQIAENYRSSTGLLVSVRLNSDYGNKITIDVKDPRNAAQYSLTKLLTLSFQDFELGNGTTGAYFWDVAWETPAFESSIVHGGRRSVKMTAPSGNPQGGTIAIAAASPVGYFDLRYAQTFSVWVYDTQGNNTVQLRLKDSDGDGGSGEDGYYLWSTMSSVQNQWTKITWNLSQYPNVPNLDKNKIAWVELFEWWDGTYYFDDLTFS